MELQNQHSVLSQRLSDAGEEHERLAGQLYRLRGTYSAAAAEGGRLEDQLTLLRSQASVSLWQAHRYLSSVLPLLFCCFDGGCSQLLLNGHMLYKVIHKQQVIVCAAYLREGV